jgi:hypothetical protein
LHSKKKIIVYPNPANDVLNISLPDAETGEITIYNPTGRIVFNKKYLPGATSISIDHLEHGIYFLQAEGDFGTRSIKFVKTL